jgi:hypothetical protein
VTEPTGAPAVPAAPPAGTFTQEQLNAIAAREKDSGKSSGRRERDTELASLLGVTPEDLPKHLEQMKKDADSRKSAADLATEQATQAKATADKATADAAAERHLAAVERALIRAGIPTDGDDADDILADAAALVRVDQGADPAAIKEAVEKVKGRHPAMFGRQDTRPPTHLPVDQRPPSGRPAPASGGRDPQVERQLRQRGLLKEVS